MNIFYISFLKIEPGLFSIVNHAFSLVRGLFSEDFFVYNHIGARKKVLQNKVSNW